MCKETLRSDCSTTPKNTCIYTSTGAYTHLGSIENSRKVINLQRLQPIRAQTLLGTGIFNVSGHVSTIGSRFNDVKRVA